MAYGQVQRRVGVSVLGMSLEFEVEGQGKKGRLKVTWMKQGIGRKREGWFERGGSPLPTKVDCWH